jgi:hypothetical protein
MIPADRERLLSNFYTRERNAGASPLEANESMHFFAKRLDAAQARVADDAFHRDLAVIRAVMERSR